MRTNEKYQSSCLWCWDVVFTMHLLGLVRYRHLGAVNFVWWQLWVWFGQLGCSWQGGMAGGGLYFQGTYMQTSARWFHFLHHQLHHLLLNFSAGIYICHTDKHESRQSGGEKWVLLWKGFDWDVVVCQCSALPGCSPEMVTLKQHKANRFIQGINEGQRCSWVSFTLGLEFKFVLNSHIQWSPSGSVVDYLMIGWIGHLSLVLTFFCWCFRFWYLSFVLGIFYLWYSGVRQDLWGEFVVIVGFHDDN